MSYEGCMSISTGVSYDRLEETYDVIMNQFERMKQGDFTDQDLETAKIMLKDSVRSTADDMNATLNFEYQNLLLNQKRTLNDPLKDIENTTKDDVVRLFNRIHLKVTYTLKQEVCHEEDR
jgi:predicted Zn-dependent peptidase